MWTIWIDEHTTWLSAAGCSHQTIRLRRHYLERLSLVAHDPAALTADVLAAFVGRDGWAAETRRSARASVRSFCRWMHQTGRISMDPSMALPPVQVPAGVPRPCPEPVLAQALHQADDDVRLMLLLGAYAGLRRGEIAELRPQSFVGGALYVEGKGGRARRIPVHPRIESEIPGRDGWLFPGRLDGHLSPGWVGVRMAQALGSPWTAHSLRHRFASRAYAGSRDLLAVQELLGHSKPETTRRYTQTPDGALWQAVLAA